LTDIIKKAGQLAWYGPDEIEHLKRCTDTKDGPLYFMEKFLYVQHPVKGRIKFVPYEYQKKLIDGYANNRYVAALLGRQLGKCLCGEEMINIRNKKTGEIKQVTFKEMEELINNGKGI
jgi:hypothetical protein